MKETERIKDFLSNAKFDEAISTLERLTTNKKNKEFILSISSKYNKLKDEDLEGILTNDERNIEIGKIIKKIQSVISKIEIDENSNSTDFQLVNKSEIDFSKNKKDENYIRTDFQLVKQSEREFIDKLDFSQITEILIIGHTGRIMIGELYQKIDSIPLAKINPKLSIKILLRSPYSENQERYSQIYSTIENNILKLKVKYINVEVRYYDSIPYYRAILCKLSDNSNHCFISSYKWIPMLNTKAFDCSFIINGLNNELENKYYQLVLSWFKHFWGKNEIHTIVFDFDDTLISSLNSQVTAWYNTILLLIDSNELKNEYCSDEINKYKNCKSDLEKYIKNVFLEQQLASEMMKVFFPKIPSNHSEIKRKIDKVRFNEREKLTFDNSKLFDGVKDALNKLKEDYQLVIVSATSESLIRDVLLKHKIIDCFSMILGKYGPKSDWEDIHDKANLIIKLSRLIGIGIERMVYIGDNNSDYKSTKQIHLHFIECRIIAKLENLSTLIKYENTKNEMYFEAYDDNLIYCHLEKLNKLILESKYKLNTDYLKK